MRYAMPPEPDGPDPWLAVSFAAFYLLLPYLPARGILHRSPAMLPSLHLTVAVVFLTIAIPLKAQGRWLTIGWLVEGAALLWVAIQVRSRLLNVLALLCLALGLVALVVVNPPASTMPFLNQRFAAFCVGIAVFTFVTWLAGKAQLKGARRFHFPGIRQAWWRRLRQRAHLLAIGWRSTAIGGICAGAAIGTACTTIACTHSSRTRHSLCCSAPFCWGPASGETPRSCAGRRSCCWP